MIMTMIAVLHARERSPIAKKIWWSIHPRKFGYNAAYDLPSVQTLGEGERSQKSASRGRGKS